MDGVLIIDKPSGLTSHDVVNRVRRMSGERSVGHLGTLDPMATGVLPLVLGRMTRLAQFYTGCEKTYDGEIRFGFATDTYDSAGDLTGSSVKVNLNIEQIRVATKQFIGSIEQMPPPFSAKKIAGVPAYKLARKKQEVVLKPVRVEIKEFEILSYERETARFKSRVTAGTYLRSIAHELGQKLGVGAHLAALRRSAVGEFSIGQAHTLEELNRHSLAGQKSSLTEYSLSDVADISRYLLHPRSLLPQFPCVTVPPDVLPKLLNGNPVNLPEFSSANMVKVFRGQSDLIAIAQRVAGTLFQPKVVLAPN